MIGELLGILLILFGIFWIALGLIWAIAYPTLLIWGLVFSGKNLDEMIANTVERETEIISKLSLIHI